MRERAQVKIPRRFRAALSGSLLCAAALSLSLPAGAGAANPGSYLEVNWNAPAPATAVTQTVTPTPVPPATELAPSTYWSLAGGFAGGASGEGWFMGLQTDGFDFNGHEVGDEALFSVLHASSTTPGPSSTCGSFTLSEEQGLACYVPIPVLPGHSYAYALSAVASDSWEATVTDLTTGDRVIIGTIQVPAADTAIDGIFDYLDNFSTLACSEQQPAAAQVTAPLLDAETVATYARSSPGACTPASVLPGPSGAGVSLNTAYNPGPPASTAPPTPTEPAPAPTEPAPAPTEPAPAPISTTAPPAPTSGPPATTTAPTTTPRKLKSKTGMSRKRQNVPAANSRGRHVDVKVSLKWTWVGRTTRLQAISIGHVTPATSFHVRFMPAGRKRSRESRDASTKSQLRSLMGWLEHKRFRAGDRLSLDIRRPGYLPERALFTIRANREPRLSKDS